MLPSPVYCRFVATNLINYRALRTIRQRSGFDTLTQFAQALRDEEGVDVHPDHLSNIEKGRKNASPSLLAAMARVLRVTVTTLLNHPDEPPQSADRPERVA